MSRFQTQTLSCPSCGEPVEFEAVISVNADRRPDLRLAILDASFQRQACPKCGTSFRLDPEMNYLDVARGQWLAAFPIAKLAQWKTIEEQASSTFARAYGEQASAAARAIAARAVALGTETVLHRFGKANDGQIPQARLVMDKAGNLYGTTPGRRRASLRHGVQGLAVAVRTRRRAGSRYEPGRSKRPQPSRAAAGRLLRCCVARG